MIIKQMDSLKTRKLELEILKKFQLPQYKRNRVYKEHDCLIKGEQGEKNTAYYLNFDLKNNKNWMVIHDLRIEHDGEVAQIDHLLIGRLLDMYVLETKTFGDKLQMHEDGSFTAIYGNKTFSIPSPIEQNSRHIRLLRSALQQANILPKRLGITIPAKYHNIVLLDPKTNFLRPHKADSSMVMKSDQFLTQVQKDVDKPINILYAPLQLTKAISPSSLKTLASKVAALHVKGSFNYKEYFAITDEDLNNNSTNYKERFDISDSNLKEKKPVCNGCSGKVTPDNISYCKRYNERFKEQIYCFNCQKNIA